MPETIGLIERAAALLRERDAVGSREPERFPPAEALPAVSGRGEPPPGADGNAEPYPGGFLDIDILGRHGVALPTDRRSRTAEEFRLIRHNLVAAWAQQGASPSQPFSRVIMVASPLAGEGKTFVAVNLALAFASGKDHSALLIDADTEHPLVPSLFGTVPEKGVVDVLRGHCQLHDALLRTSLPGLEILAAGERAPDVPELFSSRRMMGLLAGVTERHRDRYVIIDTPPCLLTSEATALAPLVGQVVLVIEAHRTQRQEIESALNLLGKCPHVSLLLNKSDRMASEHFGSYGSYYYSGGRSEDRPEDG